MSRFDTIFALDPGTTQTAWCRYSPTLGILSAGILPNEELLALLESSALGTLGGELLAVEWVECFGMAVGREVFETVFWCGRFVQALQRPWVRVPRREVKLYLCNSARAQDSNIRQALLDRLGSQGSKKTPGPTYGFKSHCWAAAAVAVTAGAALWSPDGPRERLRVEERL